MNANQFVAQLDDFILVNNYDGILDLLKRPETDINQAGRNNWTPIHCAISHNNPALLELFLLMNANPFVKNAVGTPEENAKEFLEDPEEILKLLPILPAEQPCSKEVFRKAIEQSNGAFIKEMISKGFVYDDVSIHNFSFTGLGIAVQKGSFDIVEQLVRQGSMVKDVTLHDWIQKNKKNSDLEQIIQLLEIEKEKQIQIMEVFCAANGDCAKEKLDACREEINEIRKNFKWIVNRIRDKSTQDSENDLWSTRINEKLAAHLNYPIEFTKACTNMVTLIRCSQKNNELSALETFKLMYKTERLIKHPNEYREFLNLAKGCQMVAGGRLSAYIMLIAGWAAKIVSAGCWGESRINYANEQLKRLDIMDEYAKANENRMLEIGA